MTTLRTAASSAGFVLFPALRKLNTERDNLKEECENKRTELVRLRDIRNRAREERDQLLQSNEALIQQRDSSKLQIEALLRENRKLQDQVKEYKTWVPPGHDYSPIPDPDLVWQREDLIFDRSARELPGIDMREQAQRELHDTFLEFYDDVSFPESKADGSRYFYENNFFPYCDAFFLYCMLRHFKPGRVVEVGSGFSSAVTLDTIDQLGLDKTECTFIDPHPERLLSLLSQIDEKRHRVVKQRVEFAPLSEFETLTENDILFIDSSHVSKTGSDVNHVFFEILPRLQSGVLVHIHDIPYPFEYSRADVYEGRAWNEAYLARAFMQFNSEFELLLYPSYVATLPVGPGSSRTWGVEWYEKRMQMCAERMGPSLWLRKR